MLLREALQASHKGEAEHDSVWGYAPTTVTARADGRYHASSYMHESEWQEMDFLTIEEVEGYVGTDERWTPAR